MLFDALIGICICSCALLIAFELLSHYVPPPSLKTYTLYKQILNNAPSHTLTLQSHTPTLILHYQLQEYNANLPSIENLHFYVPSDLQ